MQLERQEFVVESGALPPLVRAMHSHDATLQSWAATALAQLLESNTDGAHEFTEIGGKIYAATIAESVWLCSMRSCCLRLVDAQPM